MISNDDDNGDCGESLLQQNDYSCCSPIHTTSFFSPCSDSPFSLKIILHFTTVVGRELFELYTFCPILTEHINYHTSFVRTMVDSLSNGRTVKKVNSSLDWTKDGGVFLFTSLWVRIVAVRVGRWLGGRRIPLFMCRALISFSPFIVIFLRPVKCGILSHSETERGGGKEGECTRAVLFIFFVLLYWLILFWLKFLDPFPLSMSFTHWL